MDVTVPALLLFALFAAGAHGSGYNVSKYATSQCDRVGFMCSADCTHLYYCDSATSLNPIEVDICNANLGLYCNVKEKRCSSVANSCKLPSTKMTCTTEGYFPDPYDCTMYYVCGYFPNSDPEYFPILHENCPAGTAYDPATTTCSLKLTDKVCTQGPVPTCVGVGQSGPVPSYPHMYYICIINSDGTLEPIINECPGTFVYQTNVGCVPNTAPTPTPPPVNGVCTQPGVIPDPNNCHAYYICDQNNNPSRHGWCCIAFYFNRERGRCMLGFC